MGFSKARRRERGSPDYWYGGLYSPPFAPVPLVHEVREGAFGDFRGGCVFLRAACRLAQLPRFHHLVRP